MFAFVLGGQIAKKNTNIWMKLGCADSHRKKSRGNRNTHAVQFLCQWLAGLGVFLR